jgi:predicted HicB family RNase H-like nuclease
MKNYLEYKGYLGTIAFSAEDRVFFGQLEGINDLVNFEGDNVTDLENAFYEAVDDYLQTCKEIDKNPDKTYKGIFNVRVPSNVHRKISLLASKNGLKLNDVINRSIDYLLDHEDEVLKRKLNQH